jgi:hypothetical protein
MVNEPVTTGAQQLRLDPYCSYLPRLVGITDSKALLSSIDMTVERAIDLGCADDDLGNHCPLCARPRVCRGVRRLPRIAKTSPVHLDVLRAHFEQHYLPILRFVTVAEDDMHDPQVLAITDPDDVPTGRLAKLLGPCVVFSEDRHLRKPGLAPANWRNAAASAVELTEGIGKQTAAAGLVISPGWALAAVIRFLGRRLGVSPWLVSGLIAGGTSLLLANATLRTRFGRTFEQYGLPILGSVATALGEARLQEQTSIAALQEVILVAPSDPSVKQQVAIVLARQTKPLLASGVQALIKDYFRADMAPTLAEVRAALQGNPEFVPCQRHRWALGRHVAPLKCSKQDE